MGILEKKTIITFTETFSDDEIATILYRIALNRFQKEKEFEKIDLNKLTHEFDSRYISDVQITIKYEQSNIEEKSIIEKLDSMTEEEVDIHKNRKLSWLNKLDGKDNTLEEDV